MTETWKPVLGFEGVYSVSDQGRVRSEYREFVDSIGRTYRKPERILGPREWRGGSRYLLVDLQVGLHRKVTRYVHQLVAEAFFGPRPDGMEVCHGPGGAQDNRVPNLRWDTHRENGLDTVRQGTNFFANRTHCPKGHEYTPENTKVIPSRPTARFCRACHRETSNAARDRKANAARHAKQGGRR